MYNLKILTMKKIFTIFISLFLATGTFQTNAQTVLVNEDFEAGFPSGWTQSTLSTDGGFIHGNDLTLSSSYLTIPAHTNFVATNDDVCDCDKSADYLILPPQDFTGFNGVELVAEVYFEGNEYPAGFIETASIEVSTDSGATWTLVDDIPGYGPAAAWSSVVSDLSAYAGMSNVWVAFRYNDAGAWSYGMAVDDVILSGIVTSVNEIGNYLNNLKVYPNPAIDNIQLSFELPGNNNLSIAILDVTGRIIKNENKGFITQGLHTYSLDVSDIAAGIYTVRLNTNEGNSVKQLIIQ